MDYSGRGWRRVMRCAAICWQRSEMNDGNSNVENRNPKQTPMRTNQMGPPSLINLAGRFVLAAIRGAVRAPRPTTTAKVGRGVLTAPLHAFPVIASVTL